MGKHTKIAWCNHTWNPWRGCARVSSGCANCYAERWAKRNPAVFGTWGPAGERVAAKGTFDAPRAWDREARRNGRVETVFLGSLMDFCELHPKLFELRRRALDVIAQCPNLQFLVLTKRPDEFRAVLPWCNGGDGAGPWANVAIGATVEDRRATRRISSLGYTPAALRFLSCEPLLEDLDLSEFLAEQLVDWVIVGGESGPEARGCRVEWIEHLIGQCRAAGVPVFVKQLGSKPIMAGCLARFKDSHGGDPQEWPAHLQVRQFPAWTAGTGGAACRRCNGMGKIFVGGLEQGSHIAACPDCA